MAKDYIKELETGYKQLFGFGDFQGKSGLHHNVKQLFDISTSGSALGYLINPEEGLLTNFEAWKTKTFGSGDSSDDSAKSTTGQTPEEIVEVVTGEQTVADLDPALDDAIDAPMFTDTSMASKRSTTRQELGSKGYDTRTSQGRATTERDKKKYGTALSRMS
mgnify:CR=1 FL=1|tara:strand:- start:41 stop:526 length:486 start_codon:yes stop_codon:yes gene_type:complete